MTTDNVRNALQWLDDKGWSELIDERWTLEVYHEKADEILCNLISDLGFEEIVNIYKASKHM